jgi:hypothetical protein
LEVVSVCMGLLGNMFPRYSTSNGDLMLRRV